MEDCPRTWGFGFQVVARSENWYTLLWLKEPSARRATLIQNQIFPPPATSISASNKNKRCLFPNWGRFCSETFDDSLLATWTIRTNYPFKTTLGNLGQIDKHSYDLMNPQQPLIQNQIFPPPAISSASNNKQATRQQDSKKARKQESKKARKQQATSNDTNKLRQDS